MATKQTKGKAEKKPAATTKEPQEKPASSAKDSELSREQMEALRRKLQKKFH